MKIASIALFATMVGIARAVSCQSQGNNQGYCVDGDRDCPGGSKSVFWDTGCYTSPWPWGDDDKCCIPA